MSKKILGLDLGTNSIGWALVNEANSETEKSSIEKLGVRVIHYDNFVSTETGKDSMDPEKDFKGGKGISPNAGRTLKRSMRRNLQRYKLRRENLIQILKKHGFISDEIILSENGNRSTFETYRLRATAATEEITLEQFARVLLMINKKRGYKSSRKAKSQDEGQLIDGMEIAKKLYDENLTPGQFVFQSFKVGKKSVPDFYRSDLQAEFDKIWNVQRQFYPEILTDKLREELRNKNETATWAICEKPFGIVGIKRTTKGEELKRENYEWRAKAIAQKSDLEQLAIVLQKVNGQLNSSSGYLGAISDRNKELYFNKQTIGQHLMAKLAENPHTRLKNQVFYRQDYLDEFNRLWETQAQYHEELTNELKTEIRDVVIFYQRRLKSQKGLISFCEFESRQIELEIGGKKKIKTVGSKVCPKSSPLHQEFKIWQILNNVEVSEKVTNTKRPLEQEEKEILFAELNLKSKLSKADALKILFKNPKKLDLNYKDFDGNRTQAALFDAYRKIIELSGYGEYDFTKWNALKIMETVKTVFSGLGCYTDILTFDSTLEGDALEKQPLYQLWHLLYSFEGDNSIMENENLINKIATVYGLPKKLAAIIANITFKDEYGSVSTKAIRKILPHLKDGHKYSLACEYAGYRHSKNSLTKEEKENKVLKDKLEILPKNSLRNPVVEKILNQMVNVVNVVIATYGKPDEIRIELARELKKSAKKREELTNAINKTTAEHEKYKAILQKEFGITNPSRNDILRYKLYLELEPRGYKTLYSNTYIPKEELYSKKFDIEHIIPQACLFDDSFSNKTLESRSVNIEKDKKTAFDYVLHKYGENNIDEYLGRVEDLFKTGKISKTKYNKLQMKGVDIPEGFINRDISDTQYIAKKAKSMLEELVKDVISTTGSVTDRLRKDWQLIDIMQELNWDKYNKLGLTEIIENRDGQKIRRIKDWTKRNDHRHHAMDALTIAFTKSSYIQYLNNLNARSDKSGSIYGIETKELYRDDKGKLRFNPPMPLNDFRSETKKQLENTLISIKAKNKVATINTNISKKHGSANKKEQLTPRGQLHLETVYGSIQQRVVKLEKVGSSFTEEQIVKVSKKIYREALLKRLQEFGGDPKKAFTGKNSLDKNPIFLDVLQTQKVPEKIETFHMEIVYTIRKEVDPSLNVEKVIDPKVKSILENRLKKFNDNPKKAFVNLDESPIWLNKEKGITIKRVTISGINNAEALHDKRDKEGNLLLNANGNPQPVDFVNTGNNHHVAIYRDEHGNLQENVVSFFEAMARANNRQPVIDKDYKKSEGWQFRFTMKQNEYFVFPNELTGFNPHEIDLLNPDNYALISPNLFRVQKFSIKDYVFRHHLETTVDSNSLLKGITWLRVGPNALHFVIKVQVNHIGQIIAIGEY
jgi:CRISPR-associated endonuclease Csn1